MEFRAEVCHAATARDLVFVLAMLAMFLADPDIVYWELKSLGPNQIGPYRLCIQHASGIVTEYFDNLTRALRRMGELEDLLREAQAAAQSDGFSESFSGAAFNQGSFGGADKRPS